jgi:hypothetical protein
MMKRPVFVALALIGLISCSAPLPGIKERLTRLEFMAADNPLQLIEDVRCDIIGDSIAKCRILNVTSSKELVPRFTIQGSVVTINGEEVESGVSKIDFSQPVVMSVISAKAVKHYTVYVEAYTGLPTVWMETTSHKDITEAGQYFDGKIKIAGNSQTSSNGYIIQANTKIKAEGTICYNPRIDVDNQLGKNAYSILTNDAVSLLDSPVGRTWKFYTNTGDKTMLHNHTAFYLGSISALEYTPRFHHVNLIMNGRYYGTYLMGEDLEASEGRVNVGKDGFMLGIGATASAPSFSTAHLEKAVSVLAPFVSQKEENVNYVSSFVASAERALFSEDFTNQVSGWQKYMDIDSFVDWYLINEISKNERGAFKRNCMMNLTRGGKLKMGPLWDFEAAFNADSSPKGFVIKGVNWYSRLFMDPTFVAKVKERYDYFYSHKNDIITEITNTAEYLKYAIQEDNNKWNTYTTKALNSGEQTWLLYQQTVFPMKRWLNSRMDWLKEEFDAMTCAISGSPALSRDIASETNIGLPVMYINIDGGEEVTSKDYYLNGTFKLVEGVSSRKPGHVVTAPIHIKGRGNSSWGQPKKPYRLKFDEKIGLLGEHKDKSWVLVSNYSDKTMLRNAVSYYMGKISNLEWTPCAHFVELIVNGRYDGTYMLSEKIKISKHRVDVGDDGFILKSNRYADDHDDIVHFKPGHMEVSLEIKEPENIEYLNADYEYVVGYVNAAAEALFSSNFKDPDEGWQKYLDMDSFVDWYLIHEIALNVDCMFNFSTYMNLKRGGKLRMGPLWDFDIAYGNLKEQNESYLQWVFPRGDLLSCSQWYSRLMEDPVFVKKVKERFNYFYSHKNDIFNFLNNNAVRLHYSAMKNEERWGTLYRYTYKNFNIWGSYWNEVQDLKEWINARLEWMKKNYDKK